MAMRAKGGQEIRIAEKAAVMAAVGCALRRIWRRFD